MKKQDLSKIAMLGVLAASVISNQVYAQVSSDTSSNYKIYTANEPVADDSKFDGSKGIKEGVVTNIGRSDDTKPNEQICVGETIPQAGTLPKTLPGSVQKDTSKEAKMASEQQKLSSSGCSSSCKGSSYSDGKINSPKNSAVLKAKRSQSSFK
jgi:hypothetical protein